MNYETRVASEAWPTADVEIRSIGDGMTFRGYAAVFNSLSEDLGGFRERIDPGAFARTLKREKNIRMFLNHNADVLLASTRAGSLRLTEDDKGLAVEADLPDTTVGHDTAALVKRGDIESMSFGFQVVKETAEGENRVLQEVRLFEVSPITGWPAYSETSASVRKLAERIDSDPDALESAVRALYSTALLTTEQRDLIVRAVNARTSVPVIASDVADWRERFAAKGYTA